MTQRQSIFSARAAFSVIEHDPDTREEVELQVYQDSKTGQYFAIDNAYLINEEPQIVSTPFGHKVELLDDFDD